MRSKTDTDKSTRFTPGLTRSPWHAVSVVPGSGHCAATGTLGGRRFLSAQAPRLPVAQCNRRDTCQCSYRHHHDRRAQPRRRDELVGLRRKGYVAQERRLVRGRREDDL